MFVHQDCRQLVRYELSQLFIVEEVRPIVHVLEDSFTERDMCYRWRNRGDIAINQIAHLCTDHGQHTQLVETTMVGYFDEDIPWKAW